MHNTIKDIFLYDCSETSIEYITDYNPHHFLVRQQRIAFGCHGHAPIREQQRQVYEGVGSVAVGTNRCLGQKLVRLVGSEPIVCLCFIHVLPLGFGCGVLIDCWFVRYGNTALQLTSHAGAKNLLNKVTHAYTRMHTPTHTHTRAFVLSSDVHNCNMLLPVTVRCSWRVAVVWWMTSLRTRWQDCR